MVRTVFDFEYLSNTLQVLKIFCKISNFLYYFSNSNEFFSPPNFVYVFFNLKKISKAKFWADCVFSDLTKFSSIPKFLYCFSNLKNVFQHKILYISSLST